MGIGEWWQGHRELDMGMRAQGWSLADRILGHVVVDVERSGLRQEGRQLLDQEAGWFERHQEAAIRAGQLSAQDWPLLDASDMERLADQRQAQGWTGGDAEVPPAHLQEIADARMAAFEAERAGLRPTPSWSEEQPAAQDAREQREPARRSADDRMRRGDALTGGPGEQEMDTPRDEWTELAQELIDRYGADRMHEVVQRLEEMPLREVAQIGEHEEIADELRAAVDERIERGSTEAVRDWLRAPEDAVDEESGITAVEGGHGDWLEYGDSRMETPITAVEDGEGGMLEYAEAPGRDHGVEPAEEEVRTAELGRAADTPVVMSPEQRDDILAARRDAADRELDAQSRRGIVEEKEAVVDTAVRREPADEVARPWETAMADQDAIQAEASTGAEMAAEPGGLELPGGIEPGVGR